MIMRHARIPDPRPRREIPTLHHTGETPLEPAIAEKVVILLGEHDKTGKQRPFHTFGKDHRLSLSKPTARENGLWDELD